MEHSVHTQMHKHVSLIFFALISGCKINFNDHNFYTVISTKAKVAPKDSFTHEGIKNQVSFMYPTQKSLHINQGESENMFYRCLELNKSFSILNVMIQKPHFLFLSIDLHAYVFSSNMKTISFNLIGL